MYVVSKGDLDDVVLTYTYDESECHVANILKEIDQKDLEIFELHSLNKKLQMKLDAIHDARPVIRLKKRFSLLVQFIKSSLKRSI